MDDPSKVSPHQGPDEPLRGVAVFGIVLAASLAVIAGAVALIFGPWLREAKPLSTERVSEDFPAELREMRRLEEEHLRGYGWVDREKGVVRIPVSRAIDLLEERGLPTRTKP